ncbi:MAG: hypothetical protein Q4F41_00185 [Eubacteriales bacterium]|nr:hypothetical protein [Eubacteriales bacterium]
MVKVERTFPAPASLAAEAQKESGSYEMPDVVAQLKKDFHDKCYICELKGLQDPQVEHLLPHKGGMYRERKFDWKNLFWSCSHCNSIKNQRQYDEGILDCCQEDPEKYIAFRFSDKNEIDVSAICAEDETAVRTAKLICEVFNMRNTGMRIYRSDFRLKALQAEMNVLFDNLEELKRNPASKAARRKLKALLRRESAFAAFKRGYLREHLTEYPTLKEDFI